MRKLWPILVVGLVIGFTSNAFAEPSSIHYLSVRHLIYENGDPVNLLYFDVLDESGNQAQYTLESINLNDPSGTNVPISDLSFSSGGNLSGRYDAGTGQWSYDQNFGIEKVYLAKFETFLAAGSYSLNVVIDGQAFSKDAYYNGIHEQPIISSSSFQKQYDENGNLYLRWKSPLYTQSGLATSVRAYITAYNDSTSTNYYLYVTIPSYLGSLYVPSEVMNMLKSKGNIFKVFIQMRTNDNANRSYSDEIILDQIPGFSDYDVNNDGKTGLVEAIHALRIAAGIINP
jgi:hypothetical protein